MIYATNAIAATVTPPLMGWLADRKFRSERLMAVLNVVGAISLFGCFYSTSFVPFYGWMLLFNLAFIPTFSLEAGLCFYHLTEPARQYPAIRVWGTVSFMLMGLGLSYFRMEDSATPLLFGGIVSLLTALYCLTLPATPPTPGFNWASLHGEEVRSIFRDKAMIVLILGLFASCVPASFYYSFLNPFLNEVGVEQRGGEDVAGPGARNCGRSRHAPGVPAFPFSPHYFLGFTVLGGFATSPLP